jgi:hypothetical protein
MKLATFDTGTERHIGVIDGDQVIDLTAEIRAARG